jgi:general stress protein YciG
MANTQSGSDTHSSGHKKESSHGSSSAAGQKHVTQEQVGSGKEHDPNNFANDPKRAAEAGRKGGHHSHDRD